MDKERRSDASSSQPFEEQAADVGASALAASAERKRPPPLMLPGKEAVEAALELLTAGFVLTLHATGGKRRPVYLFHSALPAGEPPALYWCAPGKRSQADAGARLPLAALQSVASGKDSPQLFAAPAFAAADRARCVCIAGSGGDGAGAVGAASSSGGAAAAAVVLHLEAESAADADKLVNGECAVTSRCRGCRVSVKLLSQRSRRF